MSQPSGFPDPIAALLAVTTCLADFSIMDAAGRNALTPRFFVGDQGVGGVIDCCSVSADGAAQPIMRVESKGELPASGAPIVLSKHGCVELTMGIMVTFLTCFKTITKAGSVVTKPEDLAYSQVIQNSRWQAITELRCCRNPLLKFVSAVPINTDGKCSGWQLDLQAALSLCDDCQPPA